MTSKQTHYYPQLTKLRQLFFSSWKLLTSKEKETVEGGAKDVFSTTIPAAGEQETIGAHGCLGDLRGPDICSRRQRDLGAPIKVLTNIQHR